MNFRLTPKLYTIAKATIWISYVSYLAFITVVKGSFEMVASMLISGVVIQMTIISFIENWYKRKRPTLLDWFRVATFVVIVLNYFSIISSNDNVIKGFANYDVSERFLVPTLFVVLVGIIGMKAGELLYSARFKNRRWYKTTSREKQINLRSPFLFYCFSFVIGAIQISLMLSGNLGYGDSVDYSLSSFSFIYQILNILGVFILSVYSVLKYLYHYRDTIFNVNFLYFAFIQFGYGLLSGMKENVIGPLVIILIPYIMGGYKLSKQRIIIVVLCILVIYPINNSYRVILNASPDVTKIEAIGLAVIKLGDTRFEESLQSGGDSYVSRLSLFPYLVYSVENEAKWTYYKNLTRYIYLPVAWILPRFIIPSKPTSGIGAILNMKVNGNDTSSITPTTYGWAYFEGGYFYVFILFLFFGLIISFFQNYLSVNTLLGILLYVMILLTLLKVEEDIYFIVAQILQTACIYFVFTKVFFVSRQRKLD